VASGRAPFRLIAWRATWVAISALALFACKADIPDGIYSCKAESDCPDGFSCRHEPSGTKSYCYARAGDGNQHDAAPNEAIGSDGGLRDAGSDQRDAGSDQRDGGSQISGDGGAPPAAQTPPTSAGFSSLGERRSGPGLVLYGDGFERVARGCSADGALCVTGGFVP
jgi:hypothetical protein